MKNIRSRVGRKGLLLWGILALAILAIVLLAITRPRPEPPVEAEARPYPVRVQTVVPRVVVDSVTLPGRLEARRDSWLATERAGRITAIHADRGHRVREGDVLLEVSDRVWRTYLDRAEVERDEARRDLDRLKDLRETGAVSEREYDRAAARAAHADAAYREAKTHVEQCVVRAPFAGIIDDRAIEVGEFAPEGRAVLRLVAADPLTLWMAVPERDIGALKPGDRLSFALDTFPGESFEGRVRVVSFSADPNANTFRIEADVSNAEGRLRSGLIARVHLDRRIREEALTAPLASILPRRGEDVVFLVENGHAVRRVVAIDALVGTDAVLSRGLTAGDRLVIEGHRDLADGAAVRVVDLEVDEGETP